MSGEGRQEHEIYSDDLVRITSTRVVIGGVTYALRNITSVRTHRDDRLTERLQSYFLGACGMVMLIFALFNPPSAILFITVSLLFFGWACYWLSRATPRSHLLVRTSSGELSVLVLQEHSRIIEYEDQIGSAISNY